MNLAVGRTHFIYTQYINRLHGRSGHLWQGRFHSCPMDDAYAVTAMRCVQLNGTDTVSSRSLSERKTVSVPHPER